MAARSFWKGYLKLSLVTCPVAMAPATSENDKVRFHLIDRKTGNRVVSQYVDGVTGKPVDEDDEVRGYPRGEDDFVILEDEELQSVDLESARTIDIERFAPVDSVDWIWRDTPYYVTPDDSVGTEAYCVIRDAMRSTGMAGLSRLVLQRRERAVMLKARDNGIVLWTLRYGEEMRDASDYFDAKAKVKLDPKLTSLIAKLIEERKKPWSPVMVRDPVQTRLIEIIKEKRKSASRPRRTKPEAEPAPSNVINIMDALRRSVAADGKPGRGSGRPKT